MGSYRGKAWGSIRGPVALLSLEYVGDIDELWSFMILLLEMNAQKQHYRLRTLKRADRLTAQDVSVTAVPSSTLNTNNRSRPVILSAADLSSKWHPSTLC